MATFLTDAVPFWEANRKMSASIVAADVVGDDDDDKVSSMYEELQEEFAVDNNKGDRSQ
jgi:hypothetical protein